MLAKQLFYPCLIIYFLAALLKVYHHHQNQHTLTKGMQSLFLFILSRVKEKKKSTSRIFFILILIIIFDLLDERKNVYQKLCQTFINCHQIIFVFVALKCLTGFSGLLTKQKANQWTGFYMITASVLKGLKTH